MWVVDEMLLGPLQCAALLVVLVLYPTHTDAVTCAQPGITSYAWTLKTSDGIVLVGNEITTEPQWTLPILSPERSVHVEVHPVTGLDQAPLVSRSFVLRPCPGDLDYDGAVGIPDFLLVSKHWGQRCDL